MSSGISINAITSGTANFFTYYEVENGERKMVSFGNYARLDFGSNRAYYAHLSGFMSGFTAPSYPNCDPVRGYTTGVTQTLSHGSASVSEGTYLGASGNTGFSTGPHLHFEIREGTTVVDPFKYVLFAKMPK